MAKKRDGDAPDAISVSSLVTAMREHQMRKCGTEDIYPASALEKFMIGFPVKSLALQYLLDSNVLLLGKVYGISGPPESQKSSFALWIARQFLDNGGFVDLKELEGFKVSPSLVESLIGQDNMDRVTVAPCGVIDDAQRQLTTAVQFFKEKTTKNVPWAAIIDSLSGSTTEETYDKIDKDGAASRDFPSEALSWTKYFKKISADISCWPICLFFVNHEKQGTNSRGGPPTKVLPGGIAQRFHASTILSVQSIGRDEKSAYHLNKLKMTNIKASMGTGHRSIQVEFQWYFGGDRKQVSLFNWADADAMFLASEDIQALAEVRDILPVTCNNKRYSCKKLGLVGVIGEELGSAMFADAALVTSLQEALHIKQHSTYAGVWPTI